DDRSFLYLHGRVSDVINRGGGKFYPIEVETVLHTHDEVAEAAVLRRRLEGRDDEVVAFVVPRGEIEGGRLIAHSPAAATPDNGPQRIRFVTQLPRTALGKIDKAALANVAELEP